MLPLPPKTTALGQGLFHDRGRIDEDLHLAFEARHEELGQMFQPTLDEIVVVAVPGVNRYRTFASLRDDREGVIHWRVGKRNDNHTPGLGPERLRMASLLGPGG